MTLKLTDPAPKIWGENLPYWYRALARLGSIFLMLSGLYYWADILGVFGASGLERGDWQAAALRVVLSCSFLIASVGVWQLSFWGVVMWVLSVVVQATAFAMHDAFAMGQTLLGIAHLSALLALAGASSYIYLQARRAHE